ncbi:transposase family protein [Streptomyces lomondensis]|uniref:transposase family protein n=1 Tax=Streptomyces lomondensis TaxID=68229 RepID=UPI001E2DF384|nr:transposase family protein [Streptomyces lomondensis]MCF0083136.1 transposase family protein [Streptomyces lomondensis]
MGDAGGPAELYSVQSAGHLRPAGGVRALHERQRKAHSSRRIRVEHGIAHLKNWRALARHLGRREHMSDIVRAVASLLSHQQTADLIPARQS